MAITQAICTSFKKEVLEGLHNFLLSGGDTFRLALYTSSATLDATTTAYTSTNEVASGGGYTTNGNVITRIDPSSSGTTGFVDITDEAWASATFTTRGALLYNDTASGNPAVCVLDFGSDKSPSNQTFTVVFPAADATNAIIRFA